MHMAFPDLLVDHATAIPRYTLNLRSLSQSQSIVESILVYVQAPPLFILFSTVMAIESGNRLKSIFGTKPSSNASAGSPRPKKTLSEREPDATLVDDRFSKDPARDRQRDRAVDIELPIGKRPYPRFAGL